MSKSVWASLFLAMPNLHLHNDLQVVFNSNEHGFSFNRLQYSIVGYKGPLLFLFEHQDEGQYYLLGAYIDSPVLDKARFHGNVNSCLFQVYPELKVFRTYNNEGGENYVYLNSTRVENSEKV